MTVTEAFASVDDLAKSAIGKAAIMLVVGSRKECNSLIKRLEELVIATERIVHVEPDAEIFNTLENPKEFPAIGIWSAKGSFVGYRDHNESIEEFLAYARRYC